jgi:hypothetical protein
MKPATVLAPRLHNNYYCDTVFSPLRTKLEAHGIDLVGSYSLDLDSYFMRQRPTMPILIDTDEGEMKIFVEVCRAAYPNHRLAWLGPEVREGAPIPSLSYGQDNLGNITGDFSPIVEFINGAPGDWPRITYVSPQVHNPSAMEQIQEKMIKPFEDLGVEVSSCGLAVDGWERAPQEAYILDPDVHEAQNEAHLLRDRLEDPALVHLKSSSWASSRHWDDSIPTFDLEQVHDMYEHIIKNVYGGKHAGD